VYSCACATPENKVRPCPCCGQTAHSLQQPAAGGYVAVLELAQRRFDCRELLACLVEQCGGVLPFERERRALGVVLVVGTGRARGLGDVGELPLQRLYSRLRAFLFSEQQVP
jgi:hypothetical protein